MDLSTPGGVIEMKTSRANWTQARADNEYQAACYDWAYEVLEGRKPGEVRLALQHDAVAGQVVDRRVAWTDDGAVGQ